MNGVRVQQRRLESALPWLAVTLGLALLTAVLIATPRTAWAAPGSQPITTSGTFTVPPGVTSMTVEVWGGGGGGAGGDTSVEEAGGGGGGGGYARLVNVSVVPGTSYVVTIGAGGSGGTGGAANRNGGDGGFTSVTGPGIQLLALGGKGATGAAGGAPGAGQAGAGITTANGGAGGSGATGDPNVKGGGGGGTGGVTLPAGTGVNGGAGQSGASGGDGGPATGTAPSMGGAGGSGNTNAATGTAGTGRGAGGGGGGENNGNGGAGAAGFVLVSWDTPVPSTTTSTAVASPTEVDADNVETSTVTVTVKDSGGANVQGALVTLAANPSNGVTITESTGVYTNSSGVATFTVRRSVAGQVTFTATIETASNDDIEETVNVNFVEVGPPGCESPKVAHETFAPGLASSGVTISIWGGGRLSEMPTAVSYWTTYNGAFIGYIPGVGPGLQQTVNGEFLSRYGTDLPPCLGFVVRR